MVLTRLNALQYTKVKVISAPYEGGCAQSYFLSQVLPPGFKHLKSILKSQHYSAAGAAQPSSFPRYIPLQHLWAFFGTVSVEFPVKAQMPAVFRLPASAAILCCLLRCEDFAHQVCSLGGGLTDLHACCFQSFLLRLSGLLAVVSTMNTATEA